jgi:triosephosphate isomerase
MPDAKKLIVANWKMHGDAAMAAALVDSVAAQAAKSLPHVEVVLCPPATLIGEVARRMIGSRLHIGGQDCHGENEGAYTGCISARMLRAAGCSYVIVGHSERRAQHGETNALIRQKAQRACEAGLVPILCVGETQQQREAGSAIAVVSAQIAESLPEGAAKSHFVLAYEPVWAIGSGKIPASADILEMHAAIIGAASAQTGLERNKVCVLYGGSVTPANAREILGIEGVGGVLVGGASLDAKKFCGIIECGV